MTHGTTAADWVGDDLTAKDLTPYFGPSTRGLERAGVRAIFLGYYFPWDPEHTRRIAEEHGFKADDAGPRTGYYAYADIDDDFISIHHWMKWYKFGFTRLFDNLSLEIRNGRITRDEAVTIVCASGERPPLEDIALFCRFAGISEKKFFEIAEWFRDPRVWAKGPDGVWHIPGFLVDDWRWS